MGRPPGQKVQSKCAGCSQTFEQLPSDFRRGRKYCSRDCYSAHAQINGGRTDGLWTCTACKIVKPVDEFYPRKSGRPASRCKACVARGAADWIKKNQRRQREYNLKSKLGLTGAEVDAMCDAQEWKCKGCNRALLPGKGRHVDHCHESGLVRGILCQRCNMALGLLHDNPETLETLATYLRQAGSVSLP